MKKITVTMMMFVGLLTSCSNEEQTVLNENNVQLNESNIELLSGQTTGSCADAGSLGGSATLSAATGTQVLFSWNNAVEYATDKTYISYIEVAEDPTCPNPVWAAAPVASTYPVDVFNTSSLVIPGFSAKCFNWRIVINGYTGSTLDCTTTTEWKSATYVQ